MGSNLEFPKMAVRPVGKRSDPQWQQKTIFLRTESYKQAENILKSQYGTEKTMSDLMEALLNRWVKDNQ